MVSIFKQPVTAADIKRKARELGADLVGIADGALLERHPPDPSEPRRPSDVTEHDGGIVTESEEERDYWRQREASPAAKADATPSLNRETSSSPST